VGGTQQFSGIKYLFVRGEGGKIRYVLPRQEAVVRINIRRERSLLQYRSEAPWERYDLTFRLLL
jgi:hypothetical protein